MPILYEWGMVWKWTSHVTPVSEATSVQTCILGWNEAELTAGWPPTKDIICEYHNNTYTVMM
jgi:hypothetical protein